MNKTETRINILKSEDKGTFTNKNNFRLDIHHCLEIWRNQSDIDSSQNYLNNYRMRDWNIFTYNFGMVFDMLRL